jgi:hypothetical protein
MKIQIALIFIAFIVFTNCDEKTTLDNIESEPKQLYDFDKVEHYYLEIDDSDLENIYPEHKVCIDMVVYENYPMHLDTLPWCYDSLEFFGFTKKIVSKDMYEELENIFVYKEIEETLDTECIQVYRDVLVFYKNNKWKGLVSLCLSCNDAIFINAGYSTSGFGYNGEYDKLEKILHNN